MATLVAHRAGRRAIRSCSHGRWVHVSRFGIGTGCSGGGSLSRRQSTSTRLWGPCWNCGHQSNLDEGIKIFCANEECGKIQVLATDTDYFDLLGLPQGKDGFLSVDKGHLERAMKDLQKRLHPDLFADKSYQEQEHSAANSALVNRAYQCLRSDISRAAYILERYHGLDVLSESSGSYHDNELNMQIFALREEIDDLDPQDHPKRDALLADFKDTLDSIRQDLHDAIAQKDRGRMAKDAIRMQYWGKMILEMQEGRPD